MKTRGLRKVLSIMLAALMIVPLIVFTPQRAEAQSYAVNITIVNVTRRYRDSASYLKLCNDYRSENELDPWVMDEELYELAMKKAAELAVYVDEYNLDGSYFLNNTEEERGLMIGYGVSSSGVLFNSFKSETKYVSYLLSEKYKSVGIGSVEVDGKKYVCVLLSGKDPVPVDSSVLTQINKRLSQKTQCNPSYLIDNKVNFKDDSQVVCGKEFSINLVVHNLKYDDANTVVTSDDMELLSSDTNVFMPTGSSTLIGTGPGTALITMKLKGTQAVNASVRLKSIAYDINNCKFTAIPDQSYSGTELRPGVSLLTSTNVSLAEGKDYELTYYNNTEVGQAQVTIKGIGSYSGSSRTEKFNIISDPNAFGAALKSDVSEIELGQSAKLTASFVNGKEPVSFKYEYALQGSSEYEMICEEGTDCNCSFKPTAAGTYVLRVTAADAENKIAAANVLLGVSTPLSVVLEPDASELIIGDTLKVSAIAEGGKLPYKYAYYILEPGKTEYRLIASYGDLTALTYTPTALGEYRIRCDVKGSNDLTATTSESFTVSPKPLVNDSIISSTSVKTGKEINLNAQASGGIEPYSYAYSYKEISSDEWTMISGGNDSGFVTEATEIFSQSEAGTYVLRVSVKDSDNKIVDKDFTVTVFEDPLRNDSVISTDSAGNSVGITISGKAGGGEEPYRYAYYYKDTSSSVWTKLS